MRSVFLSVVTVCVALGSPIVGCDGSPPGRPDGPTVYCVRDAGVDAAEDSGRDDAAREDARRDAAQSDTAGDGALQSDSGPQDAGQLDGGAMPDSQVAAPGLGLDGSCTWPDASSAQTHGDSWPAISPDQPPYAFAHFTELARRAQTTQVDARISDEQRLFLDWIQQYVRVAREDIRLELVPHLISVAMKRMYLQATVHEEDIFGDLYQVVLANPTHPYWANCFASAALMYKALAAFCIQARLINLWQALDNGHTILEYLSPAFNKWVLYDALYGVLFLDSDGTPASTEEIEAEIARVGLHPENWNYTPTRIFDFLSTSPEAAADPRYEYYNTLDYSIITTLYFNIVAIRSPDTTMYENLYLPNETIAKGYWKVYDNTQISALSAAELGQIWTDFFYYFSIKRTGRYYLDVHRLEPDGTFTTVIEPAQ